MDATWQSSIDRTLRSTEATLEQLQSRRVSYDRAKRKVDDYLGASPIYHDSEPTLDMLDQDWSLPPPLPQHLRYRAARAKGSSPAPISLDHSTPARRPRLLSSTAGASDSRPADPSSSPLHLANAQVRGALLELELEKAKRADSVRELAYRTTAEIAEVRSLITQLQTENGALKKSVRALEGRLGFEGNSDRLHRSAVNGVAISTEGAPYPSSSGAVARSPRAAVLPSAVASSGFSLGHDASMAAGASASLVARVEALEAGLARHQQQAEDRQTRVTTVLRDLVKTEVDSEMSQVRTSAREAARDSAEDLLKLRLSALQSSTQADLQKALRTASASETVAEHAQQQCRETEQRLSSHMHKLRAQLSEWERTHSGEASGSAAFSASVSRQQGQERMVRVERRVDEQLRGMQSQLQQYRADVEAQVDRLTQQHKALSGVVQEKAEAAELLALHEHLEEHQRGGSSGWMSRDQVARLLRTQLQPLHDEMRKTQAMAQETLDNTEAWRRQASMRFAAIEASMERADSARTQQDLQWQSYARDVQQVRTDMADVQSRIAEAVRHAKAELVDVWDAKVQLLEERAQQAHRERQQHTDAQLRQLQQTLTEQQEAQQRARVTGESAEERLRRTEAVLSTTEATLTRAVEDVRTRYEALQAAMQQTCLLPVVRVQQDVEAVQRKLQAVEEDRARLNDSWTHHLAEAKQYHEERVRHAREVLEQRLAHHKELYEELRSQQTLQRRVAEEQHQQLMDRIRHVQQEQLMVSSVVAPAPAHEPPADAESTPALATAASATIASTSVPDEYQRTLQLLVNRLQDLDERIEAVEGSCANVPLTIADSTTLIAKRLEGLQDRVEAEADDWRRRHDELERDTELELGALSRRCSETAASIDAQSACTVRRVEELLSPLQLITRFSADESCLRHLALRLRDHLALSPENTAALADVQAHLEALAKTLEVVQASMQEAQCEVAGLSELRLADQAPAAVPSSSPGTAAAWEEMRNAIRSLQVALEEQRERQDNLEKGLHQLTAQQLATVTTELASLKRVTDSVPLEIARLADQYNAFQSVQRQQLPTLQKYVQDVVEMVQSNQSAQMDPIQLRLRAVEDRHKHLQARLEEVKVTHEANATERAQDLQKKLDQQQQVQKAVEGQLVGLRDDVAATQAELDSLARRMTAAEQGREHVSGMVTSLQVALSPTNTEEVAAAKAEELVAPDPAAHRNDVEESIRGTADHLTAPGAAVAELRLYMKEIDERLTQMEEQAHDSVSVTAEMLGAFRDQLQSVVGRFAAAAAQLAGRAEVGTVKETDTRDDAAKAGALAATEADSSSTHPPINCLEDVFVFLLHRLYQLHHALQQLQSNTVDTLEILEQHEESVASLPTLQRTVDVMAATLAPLAEQLGVDTAAVRAISAQQQHHGHHYASLFPPSRSSSNSSDSEKGGRVRA